MALQQRTIERLAKKKGIKVPQRVKAEDIPRKTPVAKPVKKPNPKPQGGRPTVMTAEVLDLLKTAYSYGASDKEACGYAGISKNSLYRYIENHSEFREETELLQEKTSLLARKTLNEELKNPANVKRGSLALDYLKAKKSDEFSPKTIVDVGVSEEVKKLLDGTSHFIFGDEEE